MSTSGAADLTFLTQDHPEACGRSPQRGEKEWCMTFPLENDHSLTIRTGIIGLLSLKALIRAMDVDGALEEAFLNDPANRVTYGVNP